MQFDPAGLYGGAAPLQFRLEASSASQEVDSRDNTAGLDLQLDTEADLELVGSPGPVTLTWRAGGQVVLNNFTQTFQVGPILHLVNISRPAARPALLCIEHTAGRKLTNTD